MSQTSVGLVVRQQAWFRSFVESEALAGFPLAIVNSVALQPINVIRARVLIGRGALNHELPPEFSPWFGHGEEPYPVLQCPSIGPRGAGLFGRTKTSSLTASDQEAVCLIEVSVVQRLEQAIDLYTLYQYPVVWEPVGVWPLVAFVNLETQTLQQITTMTPDNFIPFRLNAKDKVKDGFLVDDGLVEWHRLESNDLHIPLVLFQRALWQKNLQVRFLEMFWVIGLAAPAPPGRAPLPAASHAPSHLCELAAPGGSAGSLRRGATGPLQPGPDPQHLLPRHPQGQRGSGGPAGRRNHPQPPRNLHAPVRRILLISMASLSIAV